MRTLAVTGLFASLLFAGPKVNEIKWLSSKEAFKKAKESKRWVLVYKEWPR